MFKAEFQLFQKPFLKELDFKVRVTDEKLQKKKKKSKRESEHHRIVEVVRDLNPEAQLQISFLFHC